MEHFICSAKLRRCQGQVCNSRIYYVDLSSFVKTRCCLKRNEYLASEAQRTFETKVLRLLIPCFALLTTFYKKKSTLRYVCYIDDDILIPRIASIPFHTPSTRLQFPVGLAFTITDKKKGLIYGNLWVIFRNNSYQTLLLICVADGKLKTIVLLSGLYTETTQIFFSDKGVPLTWNIRRKSIRFNNNRERILSNLFWYP